MKRTNTIHRNNIAFFTFGLALLTMMGILGVDTYLASIPDIAQEFGKSVSTTQLSIVVFTLCVGFGQLIFGPLSDSIGRRKLMLGGALIYAIMTFALTQATTLGMFLSIRILQGLCISITLVTSISSVRDVSRGAVAATLYAIIITIEGFLPIASPLLGGFLNDWWGWRAIFWFIFIYSLITLVYVFFSFPETLKSKKRVSFAFGKTLETYKRIFCTARFYLPCLSLGLSFSMIYCFVTAAPYILRVVFGFSASTFGVVSAAIGLGLLLGAWLAGKLIKHYTAVTIASVALKIITVFILVCMLLMTMTNHVSIFILFFSILMFAGGMFESLYTFLTMSSQTSSLGATAALMGAISLVFPSVIGGIGGYLIEIDVYVWMGYLLALVIVMMILLNRLKQL